MEVLSADTDAQDGRDLLRQLYPTQDFPELDLSRIGAESRLESQTLLVREEGRAVGIAVVVFIDYGTVPYGILEEMFVSPMHRGRGIGQSLVEAGVQWVADRGGRILYAFAANDGAEDFYASCGFERRERSELYRLIPTKK